jgi:alkanesulfonate monooxygenase
MSRRTPRVPNLASASPGCSAMSAPGRSTATIIMRRSAQAAAQTAFDGLFLPHRPQSDDSAIVAAAIAREVPRLALIPEFPASAGSAVYAAKQAVSFQRQTHERLGWAIATRPRRTRARAGDHVAEEQLCADRGVPDRRARRPWRNGRSLHRRAFRSAGRRLPGPAQPRRFPTGVPAGRERGGTGLSARAADVHLFAASRRLRGLIETLDTLALRAGRSVAVRRDPAGAGARRGRRGAKGCRAGGAGRHAIVGSYAEVAARLADLAALGSRHFVLAAPSSLEEAYRIGQHVLPRFRALTERVAAAA